MLTLLELRLSALHLALDAAGLPFAATAFNDATAVPPTVRIKWVGAPTQQQLDTANTIIAGWDWSQAAEDKRIAQEHKARAAAGIDNGAAIVGDKTERLVRALMEIILDEFNLHALKHNAILDATDAATSLADFKARVALIPDYPARTAAQLVNAIKAKISATAE